MTIKLHGRKKPYTSIGIRRLPCCRCGEKKSVFQWNCCANGNLWMPICLQCDIALNEIVLKFFNFANAKALLDNYRDKVAGENERENPKKVDRYLPEADYDTVESLRATAEAGLNRSRRCPEHRAS